MITRRTALGAGLALTAVASTAGFSAYARAASGAGGVIDALLIDETMDIPSPVAALIEARPRTVPVVGISLDAAAHERLMLVLGGSRTIAGISSGATLFCVERLGWDHGFRLTARREQRVDDPIGDAFRGDAAAFLAGSSAAAGSPALVRAYRPSRADGVLHAWVMQKSDRPQFRQNRGEA